jgi:23S rRNA (guanosine2251-2'-O)-methyltransferase
VAIPPTHKAAEKILRKYALSFPDAVEEFPWGERVIKVRGKIFVFLGIIEDTLRIGMKLPTSFEMALTLRYVIADRLRAWPSRMGDREGPSPCQARHRALQGLDRSELSRCRAQETCRRARQRKCEGKNMSRRNTPPERHERQRAHAEEQRRMAQRSPAERRPDALWIYGIHPVVAALANPRRTIRRIIATPNALARLAEAGAKIPTPPEDTTPRNLDNLLGGEAVHQGVAIEVAPLPALGLDALADARLIVVVDQVTDPHNVGAILRSAVAFAADAIVTTGRHAAAETGVLAKAASGALDQIKWIEVQNLARALEEIGGLGFTRIGLDGDADREIEGAIEGDRIALVLGAEGKGLRRLTRETCDAVARLSMPGSIPTLNVSNAAVLALYLASRHLRQT